MEYQIAFPFSVNDQGRTATASRQNHITQLIAQVLFTSPGERVNNPTFGCDLRSLVFGTLRNELVTAIEAMVQGSLQQSLGDIVQVQAVKITVATVVTVDVRYVEKGTAESRFVRFEG
jgi:phage baseplate assembly protein W